MPRRLRWCRLYWLRRFADSHMPQIDWLLIFLFFFICFCCADAAAFAFAIYAGAFAIAFSLRFCCFTLLCQLWCHYWLDAAARWWYCYAAIAASDAAAAMMLDYLRSIDYCHMLPPLSWCHYRYFFFFISPPLLLWCCRCRSSFTLPEPLLTFIWWLSLITPLYFWWWCLPADIDSHTPCFHFHAVSAACHLMPPRLRHALRYFQPFFGFAFSRLRRQFRLCLRHAAWWYALPCRHVSPFGYCWCFVIRAAMLSALMLRHTLFVELLRIFALMPRVTPCFHFIIDTPASPLLMLLRAFCRAATSFSDYAACRFACCHAYDYWALTFTLRRRRQRYDAEVSCTYLYFRRFYAFVYFVAIINNQITDNNMRQLSPFIRCRHYGCRWCFRHYDADFIFDIAWCYLPRRLRRRFL